MVDYTSKRYALLNRFDPLHVSRIDRLIDFSPGERVLEIGCGRGHVVAELEARGLDVVGIDANPEAARLAGTDRVLHMNAEDLRFETDSFDVILSIHALEHIPPLEDAIRETARVIKPGGRALHIYPAEPIRGLYAVPTSMILYGTPFKARQVHCHKLWPGKLQEMMGLAGFSEVHSEFNIFKSPQFISVFQKDR